MCQLIRAATTARPDHASAISNTNEDERMAMEFYIACAPEDHPVIPGAGADLHGCDLRQIAEGDPFGGGSARARKTRGTNQKSSKGRAIIMRVRAVNTGTKGRTKFGMNLEQSAREILAHVKDDVRLPTRRIVLPGEIDVKRIRTKARMSQAEFARAFCINPKTLQEWEQGRRKPDATTRAYLAVIAKDREAVLAALAS
jgi:putative transcriptional regulator